MKHQTQFYKSSQCADGTCVEVARRDDQILVKSADGILSYTLAEWKAFIDGVKLGEFDFEAHAVTEVQAS